jgi:hypothetical protein
LNISTLIFSGHLDLSKKTGAYIVYGKNIEQGSLAEDQEFSLGTSK